jgi:flagellar assembly protein FliH
LGQIRTVELSGGQERIELLQYPAISHAPAIPSWYGYLDAKGHEIAGQPELGCASGAAQTASSAEFERRLAEETRKSFEAGRERGRQEGRQAEHEAQAAALKEGEERLAQRGAQLIADFAQERDRYLHAVEHEVVKLALAIAARILRREAQMDPLLLTGAVRVALGQLSGTTEVRLRVPAADLDLWSDAVSLLPNLALKPIVIAGEGMRLGDCVIETALGSVDLGIRSQLGEIERGFFDRAGAGRSGLATGMDTVAGRTAERAG